MEELAQELVKAEVGPALTMDNATSLVAIVAFILNLIVTVAGGMYFLAQIKWETREYAKTLVDVTAKELDKIIKQVDTELHRRIVAESRNAGEAAAALRTKIHELELYIRDNFPSKNTFDLLIDDMRQRLIRIEMSGKKENASDRD